MRTLTRLSLLSVLALCSATVALAQEEELVVEDEGSVQSDEGFEPDDYAFGDEVSAVETPETRSGLDWSVGLRGSYASNSITGGKPSMLLTPEASLTLAGPSTTSVWRAGSEMAVNGGGQARIGDLHAGFDHSARLGATTLFNGSINGSLTQPDPDDSGLPANTLHAPVTIEGNAQARLTQDFGRFDGRITLDGTRLSRGPTTLDDHSTIDNSHQSYWQGGATLRLGYEITPLLSVFTEGELSAQKFDAADPTLLKFLDGRTYELRAGVSFTQGSLLSAETSIGHAWLDYFDGTLTDTQSWTYNGSVTYAPDETLALTGALETTLSPSLTVAGDTDVGQTLSGEARYRVNPWLTLRGSAEWERTVALLAGTGSWGYGAGVGLDWQSARHLVWTADYTYAREDVPPTPVNDTHTVMLGVRVTR